MNVLFGDRAVDYSHRSLELLRLDLKFCKQGCFKLFWTLDEIQACPHFCYLQ